MRPDRTRSGARAEAHCAPSSVRASFIDRGTGEVVDARCREADRYGVRLLAFRHSSLFPRAEPSPITDDPDPSSAVTLARSDEPKAARRGRLRRHPPTQGGADDRGREGLGSTRGGPGWRHRRRRARAGQAAAHRRVRDLPPGSGQDRGRVATEELADRDGTAPLWHDPPLLGRPRDDRWRPADTGNARGDGADISGSTAKPRSTPRHRPASPTNAIRLRWE